MRATRTVPIVLGLAATLCAIGGAAAAETVAIEAGAYQDFIAPDPGTSTPGAITFGFLGTPEVIAADAVLHPPADTNLAFFSGAVPTCLAVTRDSDQIVALAFAASCTVSGAVTMVTDIFGSGANGYVTSDRVATPEELVLGTPGINALMKTAADSDGTLTITFAVDVSVGVPTSFVGSTQIGGPVTIIPSGGIGVGSAVLMDEVVDDASRALLQEAADLGVGAIVGITGTGIIDVSGEEGPSVDITLTVALDSVAPTAPPSPAPTDAAPSSTPAVTPALLPNTSVGSSASGPLVLTGWFGWFVLLAAGTMLARSSTPHTQTKGHTKTDGMVSRLIGA